MKMNAEKNLKKKASALKMKKQKNSENNMIVNKKSKFSEILESCDDAAAILFESGLHCIGCPMTAQESLEEGCRAHGFSEEKIEELVDKLNKK